MPPVEVLYHFNAVPVAVKLATVLILHKDKLEPVGVAVAEESCVTATEVLVLSQPFSVWDT